MNAVVLNMDCPLTDLSNVMNAAGFLISQSYCAICSHVPHIDCFGTVWLCLMKCLLMYSHSHISLVNSYHFFCHMG